jgi:triphosphatase
MDRPDAAPPRAHPLEVELKFALPAKELRRLLRHPLLAGTRASRQLVASTYFDTPQFALRDRALSLRLRRNGRHYIQTLKANVAAAGQPAAREEWQSPVARAQPDLSQPGLREKLADLDGAVLQPVFVSRIRRSTRVLRPDPSTTVELSCDQGEIATPAGASAPISEIELELKEGDSTALFELARALNQSLPLRVETLSKAARGYALLSGENPESPRRQSKLLLAREMPVEDAFAGIVEHCLGHMLANDRAALNGEVEGIHQMRVALRRLRAMFKLFKAIVPEELRRRAVGEMKWIAGTLGIARNWDVFAAHLASVAAAFPEDPAVKALADATAAKQEEARRGVSETIASARYTDFVLQMLTALSDRGQRLNEAGSSVLLAAPIAQLGSTLLDRRYRKARKLARKFAELDPPRRHRFRIALKELRYAADALAGLYERKAIKRQLRRLAALQDDLGLLNDVATMERLLAELAPAAGDPALTGTALVKGWFGRVASEREAQLGKRVQRFLKAKPFWAAAS